MRAAVGPAFLRVSSDWEGVVPYFYLDVLGLVTIAIGNLVDPIETALGLAFVRPDGTPATRTEIAAEWSRVKALFCGLRGAESKDKRCPWRAEGRSCLAHQGHLAARAATRLRLTDDGVRMVFGRRLDANEATLRARYAAWEEWPGDAQLGTHSMAWAVGPAFHTRFPRLHAALVAGDFLAASNECRMQEAGNPGLVPRNKANRVLYRNAAAVVERRLDPEVLYWPRDLATEPVTPAERPTEPEIVDPPSEPPPDVAIVRPRVDVVARCPRCALVSCSGDCP